MDTGVTVRCDGLCPLRTGFWRASYGENVTVLKLKKNGNHIEITDDVVCGLFIWLPLPTESGVWAGARTPVPIPVYSNGCGIS